MKKLNKILITLTIIVCHTQVFASDPAPVIRQIIEFNSNAEANISQNPKLAESYAKQGLALLSKTPDFELEYHISLTLADALLNQEKFNDALIVLKDLIEQLNEDIHILKKAQVLARQGEIYWYQGNIYDAITVLEKGLSLYQAAGVTELVAKSFNNLGIMYRHIGEYETALNFFLNSLRIKEKLGVDSAIASTLNNVGVLYFYLEQYEQAIKQFDRAIAIRERNNEILELADPLNNKGQVLEALGDYEKALDFYQRSLQIEQQESDQRGQGFSHANIGAVLGKLRRYPEATDQLNQSLAIAKKSSMPVIATEAYLKLGELALEQKKFTQSLEYLEAGLVIASEIDEKDKMVEYFKNLSNVLEQRNDYQQAFGYFKRYQTLVDELNKDDAREKLARIQLKNSLEKRDKEIALLQKENDIQALQLSQEKTVRYVFIGVGVLLFVITLLTIVIRKHRSKFKRQKALSSQLSQIDEAKSQFFAQASYDLLTPLNNIINLTNDLLNSGSEKPAGHKKLRHIENSSYRLNFMVRNLLDFSALKRHQLTLDTSAISLYDACQKAIETYQFSTTDLSITFNNQINSILSDVSADQHRVLQIFFNLIHFQIGNAKQVQIYFNAVNVDHFTMVRVANYQLDSDLTPTSKATTRYISNQYSYEINVTRKLIELHGGELWIEKNHTQIATFFTLPQFL